MITKVSYDAAAKKAVLDPDVNLVRGAKYMAGNSLGQNRALAGDQPKTWTFTTR